MSQADRFVPLIRPAVGEQAPEIASLIVAACDEFRDKVPPAVTTYLEDSRGA
jgi:hypothetical protein